MYILDARQSSFKTFLLIQLGACKVPVIHVRHLTIVAEMCYGLSYHVLGRRWLLRFHFTSAPAEKAAGGGGWGLRLGGSAPASEQISWTLPLTVLPPGAGG